MVMRLGETRVDRRPAEIQIVRPKEAGCVVAGGVVENVNSKTVERLASEAFQALHDMRGAVERYNVDGCFTIHPTLPQELANTLALWLALETSCRSYPRPWIREPQYLPPRQDAFGHTEVGCGNTPLRKRTNPTRERCSRPRVEIALVARSMYSSPPF